MKGGGEGAALLAALAAGLAAAPARAAEPSEVFAVIVTNNRSTRLDRPDLQYADDDGARYYQLFASVAAPEHVHLLTRFDRATAATHAALAAAVPPPRRAELLAALRATQAGIAEARRAGKRTELYFVFAGHGDVEAGVGYLDLEDGRIDSTFLEQEVVDRVAADVQHIILDSCNSFFVVNPRKPGGRRWATPRDLALGFARHHPNVGLFLSTNSEAEVYEWSELESGIFSHEVRSGLSGAADADGDGRVSYAELAGFVERANAKLPRANLRPQVFHRGPNGQGGAPLFSPALAQGRRVVLGPDERRLWIRGSSSERLIDLHKEPGPMTVVVPGAPDQALVVIEQRTAGEPAGRPTVREYEVPAGGPDTVALASLAPSPATSAARGGAMFGDLFKMPYGARAFAAFVGQQAAAVEPVFGISAADEARMRHYLTFIAESDRDISRGQAVSLGGSGALLLGIAGATYFSHPRWGGSPGGVAVVGGLGLGLLAGGLYEGLSKPLGQRVLESFEAELRLAPENRSPAVARVESQLDELARSERRRSRIITAFLGGVAIAAAGLETANVVIGERGSREPVRLVGGYGAAALMGLLAVELSRMELPTERLLRLYRTDPELGGVHVGVAPIPGGLGLSLAGHF